MAGFGLFNYAKEGPGVAKNEPQKRAFVVFWEIFIRKAWKITLAGLLWTLVNLPILTRGLADAGLTFITRNYSREKHAFLKEDFFETIKKNWRTALPVGIINTLVTGVLFYNIYFYVGGLFFSTEPVTLTTWDYVIIAITAMVYVTFTWMKYYLPFLMITFKLNLKQLYKNAFLFACANMPMNLLISVILTAIYGILGGAVFLTLGSKMNYFVLTIVLILGVSLIPGFRSLLIQFCIFPSIKKLMIDPYYAANPGADKKARRDLNLDVADEEPTEGDAPAEEPVFVDTLPQPEEKPEPKTDKPARPLPRQYNAKEMRHFNRQVSSRNATDDDDDTI